MNTAVTRIAAQTPVAIVDDDDNYATTTAMEVEDAGFKPVIVKGSFGRLDKFLQLIHKSSKAAVCDHRLSPGRFAQFTGAQVVASLVSHGMPAILITGYRKRDIQTTIRIYRQKIPVLLDKDEVDPDAIRLGLESCAKEIAGYPDAKRIPRPTIIRVASNKQGIVDTFVPSWNPDESVPIPLNLFPDNLRSTVKPGQCYFVKVNIGADNSDELFFADFDLAPEPDPEDHLG